MRYGVIQRGQECQCKTPKHVPLFDQVSSEAASTYFGASSLYFSSQGTEQVYRVLTYLQVKKRFSLWTPNQSKGGPITSHVWMPM